MSDPHVLTRKDGPVLSIILNRPDKRNAVSYQMGAELEAAVELAATDRDVRIVALRGAGKCFCAGIDFAALAEINQRHPTTPDFRFYLTRLQGVFNKMEALEKPIVALLHSHCYGLGLELAMAADFRIATAGTSIALQEVEVGLIPDVGGTTRLTRLVGIPMAKEIIMTARKLDACEALALHLVNEVVPEAELEAALARWVERLSAAAPLAVGFAKKIIDRGATLDKLTFMELEAYAQCTLLSTDDVKEGVMAKVQKRKPQFKGK